MFPPVVESKSEKFWALNFREIRVPGREVKIFASKWVGVSKIPPGRIWRIGVWRDQPGIAKTLPFKRITWEGPMGSLSPIPNKRGLIRF